VVKREKNEAVRKEVETENEVEVAG